MSSNKYVLQTDGSILSTTFNEDGTSTVESITATVATRVQNSKFDTFESLRNNAGLKIAPPVRLPIGGLANDLSNTIISEDKNNLLKNPAFGGDENIKYYNQFNGVLSGFSQENKIYAEELEMLAGFDANSIGIIDTTKGTLDTLKFLFIFDYILETSLYIAAAEAVIRFLDNSVGEIIYKYFYDLLNYPKFPITAKIEPLAYFLIGLNEFVNTDPKMPQLIKDNLVKKSNLNIGTKVDLSSPNSFFTLILGILLDSLLALSKLEHNRILLLIRKFQQESHFHKNILYKAKQDSSENFVDKLFIEFSQYYFKFVVERMQIGRMVWRRKVNIESHKDKTINFSNRLSEDRHLKSTNSDPIQTGENKNGYSNDGMFTGDYKSKYFWREEDSRDEGNNTLSITALPQLLKTNTYIKKVALQNRKLEQNFDDSDEDESKSKPQKRLSPEIVKLIEDRLDNEYMPFYFHDLRTNEILAFHAFIDTISDSFSPQYSPSSGYGRIDDVQHYIKTTRTINTTFSLVAYNQDDHDLMWYQINKLVSMVYPQWSKGIKRNKKDRTAFPFTQMPTASPLIRLRVGDVITSNYSKENLARLHVHGGRIGRQKISTIEAAENNKKPSDSNSRRTSQQVTPRKIKPEYVEYYLRNISSINYAFPVFESEMFTNVLGESKRGNSNNYNKEALSIEAYNALSDVDKKKFVVAKNGSRLNVEKIKNEYCVAFVVDETGKKTSKKFYLRKATDPLGLGATLQANYEYENVAGSSIVNARIGGKKDGKINNPFTAAYESSRGQGLAGFITNLDVNYNESTWQTEIKGSRAPMFVKITISFAPIHDIPPGLDHLGEMRAPIYNVGSINRKMFRTPYDGIEPTFKGKKKKKSSAVTANNKPAIDLNEFFNTPDPTDAEVNNMYKQFEN